MKRVQIAILFIGFVIAGAAWVFELDFAPLLSLLTALLTLVAYLATNKPKGETESLAARNRRVMLDHVENFWVKGVLEKSLHGAALLELGIKEDPKAVNYPWTIKKESTDEILPAGKSMLDIFREIGMGRSLLILGAPGSGKTTMLLELARQLIERARKDETESIPVVFNLASRKENQTLADWLAEQLNLIYYVPKKMAPVWVNENRILLLLDGLDEVKEGSRPGCVQAINQFRREHGLISLVVCSRIEEYSAIDEKLSLNGAIRLQPLTSRQINTYFARFGKTLVGVKQLLKQDKALQELAENPLLLSIIVLAYKDRKVGELTSSRNLHAQRKHLFDTYIPRMFEHSFPRGNTPFSKQQTLRYLHYLAETMNKHNIVTYQIEAMQPSWLKDEEQHRLYRLIGLIIGISCGFSVGFVIAVLSWLLPYGVGGIEALFRGGYHSSPYELLFTLLITGLKNGLRGGVIGGLIGGLIGRLSMRSTDRTSGNITMVDRLTWSWKEAQPRLIDGLMGGLIGGLLLGLLLQLYPWLRNGGIFWDWTLEDGLVLGLRLGALGGLLGMLLRGLTSKQQIEETTYPTQRLKQTLVSGSVSMLILGLIGGLIVILFPDRAEWLGLREGLSLGLVGGLIGGLRGGYLAMIQHHSLRLLLALNDSLPRQLIALLEHAVALIFLRRVGGSYIFVHRLLMEHFAEMEIPLDKRGI